MLPYILVIFYMLTLFFSFADATMYKMYMSGQSSKRKLGESDSFLAASKPSKISLPAEEVAKVPPPLVAPAVIPPLAPARLSASDSLVAPPQPIVPPSGPIILSSDRAK